MMEMLQGVQPNPGMNKGNPQLLFAGDSLSPREWEALLRQLEGTMEVTPKRKKFIDNLKDFFD